jgi:Transposase DDE domain group 1
MMAVLYAMVAGLRRFNKTQILQYNGAFLNLLGLDCFPDQATLRRFLKSFSPATIRQVVRVHDRLRAELFGVPKAPSRLILDLDAVVFTVYGHQEGARVGYNPKKKGRRSYHPLLCFEATQHQFWHGSLRPGDTSANTGAAHFMRRCLAKVPKRWPRARIRVRADAGFFGGKLRAFLTRARLGFVLVAKLYPTLKRRALRARFGPAPGRMQTAEFWYRPKGWPCRHRFVVMRRPVSEDRDEAARLTLFRHRRYAYQVMATNLSLKPWRVWKFYVQRSAIEKHIRELLYDYPLSKLPTEDWLANVAFFHLLLLAYDLMHWFKRLCLPPEYREATLETLRSDFLVLPARLTRTGNRNVLQLPPDYRHRRQFLRAWKKIQTLQLRSKR